MKGEGMDERRERGNGSEHVVLDEVKAGHG